MPDRDYIPLMFQAQVKGRCLIHQLKKDDDLKSEGLNQQQAYDWAQEWQESCDIDTVPTFAAHVQTKEYRFTWRMVTNSGQDAVIRPVIGERGWAYFPGSSMKGAFLRACQQMCTPDEVQHYCGGKGRDGELHPGILRFHGGYPKDDQWLDDSLVDVVHPQEKWQSNGIKDRHETPKILISLYQPKFVFGISSAKPLKQSEWETIWQVWDKAMERGIGSRVSAGYGQIKAHGESKLTTIGLSGQGAASRRIDKEGEFRPNIFKAALRGHTRRLFHGLTDELTADRLTQQLWGGIGKGQDASVGLLGIAFDGKNLELDTWRGNNPNNQVPVYETGDAILNLLVMRNDVSPEQREELKSFVLRLVRFAMLLGGFGKSWRRVDHRIFYPDYKRQMIGCHWEFTKPSRKLYILTRDDLTGITKFLDTFYQKASEFSWLTAIANRQSPNLALREAWNQQNVQVWARIAEDELDSLAIDWFHQDYRPGKRIKQSDLTGAINKIGRIWHRMYPRYKKVGEDVRATNEFIELLTIFPNQNGDSQEVQKTKDFLKFLADAGEFKQVW